MLLEVEEVSADQGAVSFAATKAVSPLLGAASYRHAVKQLLTSVVREICTLRSVGAGERATAPGHPVGTRQLVSLPRSPVDLLGFQSHWIPCWHLFFAPHVFGRPV
jgi:hypothetical protein